MRLVRILAAGLTAAAVVAGCGPGSSGDSGGTTGGGDKTVRLSLTQDVDTLLPMDSNVGDNIGVLEVIYSGLVRYDVDTTEPYNYIAEDISSDDNKTWTIKIGEGWEFHNGEPVNAEAFARAWNYAAYGPNAMANNYFFESFVGYDEMQGEYEEDDDGNVTVIEEPAAEELSGLRVIDEYTLEVELIHEFAAFPTMLGYTGFFPIAQECLDDIEACAVKPIGNGPFQVEEWKRGVSLTATRWEEYPGDEAPDYDRIEWTEYAGGSSWADFQAGDMDVSSPPPEQWQSAMDDPSYSERKVERTGAALTYLGFPLYKGEPWSNPDFRKAISLAIDMESVIESVAPGRYVPADSWVVPEVVPGGTAGTCGEWCGFDPERAKQLLAEAGGWLKGEVLTISLGADPTQEAIFKAIGDQIYLNLGIEYELEPTEDFFARRSARDFDGVFRNNWFPDYPLNENYLAPVYASGDAKNGNTNFGYYNEEFEAKLAEGDQADTIDEAAQIYLEAEKILAEDFPTIPLMFSNSVAFYSSRVDNVKLNPFSGAVALRELKVVE